MGKGRSELPQIHKGWTQMSHGLARAVPPALPYERKMEKMATVLVRAGGLKQSQNLLLTSLLLWLCFGMTVRLCLVFCDELSSFRKWEAHSQHVSWTELLWDLWQNTCPDESWLWPTWLEAVPTVSNRHSRHSTGEIWVPKGVRGMGYWGFLDTEDWKPTKSEFGCLISVADWGQGAYSSYCHPSLSKEDKLFLPYLYAMPVQPMHKYLILEHCM